MITNKFNFFGFFFFDIGILIPLEIVIDFVIVSACNIWNNFILTFFFFESSKSCLRVEKTLTSV